MKFSNCRSCGGRLRLVFDLGNLYLNEFRFDDRLPIQSPLDLHLCSGCSLVQLGTSVDPYLIYTDDYGFESGINNSVKADLRDIVLCAKAWVNLTSDDQVIDIGCNDGTLLSNYKDDNVFKIGFDPVKKYEEKSREHADLIIPDFFSADDLWSGKKAKIITSISMFYDLDDPARFCEDVSKLLANDGVWVVQQNYLYSMLLQNAYDNIVHQHVAYYSMNSMNHLLANSGLRIFAVEQNDVNGGSFRTFICKEGANFKTQQNVVDLMNQEWIARLDDPETYELFATRVSNRSSELKSMVDRVTKIGQKVYAYGASTRGDTLLQFTGLDNNLIPFAVERNPTKFGKKISSLQIPIISEEQAREEQPDHMLVLPWFFFDEFRDREDDYLEGGGSFMVPLPSPFSFDKYSRDSMRRNQNG